MEGDPELLSLNQDHPSNFWSNSYKIKVMITSLIEMLELPIFSKGVANFADIIRIKITLIKTTFKNSVKEP